MCSPVRRSAFFAEQGRGTVVDKIKKPALAGDRSLFSEQSLGYQSISPAKGTADQKRFCDVRDRCILARDRSACKRPDIGSMRAKRRLIRREHAGDQEI